MTENSEIGCCALDNSLKKNLKKNLLTLHGKKGSFASSAIDNTKKNHQHSSHFLTRCIPNNSRRPFISNMDLQPLLVALMSENNDMRSQAEKSLNDEWVQNASDSLLLQLATQTRIADSETVRPHLCRQHILTFRFGLLQLYYYDEWDLKRIKRRMIHRQFGRDLQILRNNKSKQHYWRDMKRKWLLVCGIKFVIPLPTLPGTMRKTHVKGSSLLKILTCCAGSWHDLLNALFQSTKSPEAAHRESAFRVFAALPTLVDKQHIDLLKDVFLAGLQDQAPHVYQH